MAVGGGSSPPSDLIAFRKLVVASGKRKPSQNQQTFVKKLDNIPSMDLPAEQPCHTAMNIADCGFIGHFTSFGHLPRLSTDGFKEIVIP